MPTNSTSKPEEHVIDFEPVFTDKQVDEFEARYNETWGVKRRLMMIVLARSKSSLMEGFNGSDGTALVAMMIDAIVDYREHLRRGIEIAEAALSRLRRLGTLQ